MDNVITSEMKQVARMENIDDAVLQEQIKRGSIIIMLRNGYSPVAIGKGLATKVNVNLGTSPSVIEPEAEIEKAEISEKYGADTVSELSMGGDIDAIRREVAKVTTVPLTTVPIYQVVAEHRSFKSIEPDDIYQMIKKHVDEGISSVVLHAGFDIQMLQALRDVRRVMGMVSKGGALTAAWMLANKRSENPFVERFDEILDILKKRDVVLSLGNTMRSGCVHDLKDSVQLREIEKNIALAKRANEHGVQTIIEALGGHVRATEIVPYVKHFKQLTNDRPLFVAGPLPIEVGVGYDHIAAAVGGALAAGAGADYLCYITPAEHLSLPAPSQVREGLIAFRIAAHIGDSIKYGLSDRDLKLAYNRRKGDWNAQFSYALDPERARELHPKNGGMCTMCGKYCAIRLMEKYLFGE